MVSAICQLIFYIIMYLFFEYKFFFFRTYYATSESVKPYRSADDQTGCAFRQADGFR